MNRLSYFCRFGLVLLASLFLSLPTLPSKADSGANHQVSNPNFGVSGGNVNDITRRFCCSGTLGSLVQDSNGVQYILSNNHVLARVDQASPGEDISQPGLVDNNCALPPIVADFTTAVPLGNNVDAAIAQLRAGKMNTVGTIEDVGIPSNVVKTQAVGLSVAKSGRTTGFTTGTVSAINTSVSVQYQRSCGSGKKFVIPYTNQVVINSTTFSAAGDSGSLIVTNDSCHQPVALLFAGSSTSTIGNPIGEVLSKLSTALGSTVSFVGTTCSKFAPEEPMPQLSPEAVEQASRILEARREELMSRTSVIGVGIGASDTDASKAAIVIYVDKTTGVTPKLPKRIKGLQVRVVFTDPFVAY